jgi:hypothetical protein
MLLPFMVIFAFGHVSEGLMARARKVYDTCPKARNRLIGDSVCGKLWNEIG